MSLSFPSCISPPPCEGRGTRFFWLFPILLSCLALAPRDARGRTSPNIKVAPLTQEGALANCGPTAAAMVIAHALGKEDATALRDLIGRWSWARFPMRAFRLPGGEPGMTTPSMMHEILSVFGVQARVTSIKHPFLPGDMFALMHLRALLESGRPVVLMVESPVLWGTRQAGLHWIVVRGVEGENFLFNDPADGSVQRVSTERLWRAWRLHPLWRRLPGIEGFTGFVLEDAPFYEGGARRVAGLGAR